MALKGVHSKEYANQNIYATSEFVKQVQSYEQEVLQWMELGRWSNYVPRAPGDANSHGTRAKNLFK